MLKIASKLVLPALIAVMLAAVLPVVAAFAAPGYAKDLTEGCWADGHRWITFGEYNGKPLIWRVLEVGKADDGSPTAFLLAEDAVAEKMKFDYDSNDWDSSDIKKWLNEDFYRAAFSEEEREAILTSAYRYGGEFKGSDKTAASKVFLLSTDEAEDGRYFASDADRSWGWYRWWWLRSPGSYIDKAALVSSDGEVCGGGSSDRDVDVERAVRPTLKINLSSSIFTSPASASKYEILYGVNVKVRSEADTYPVRGAVVHADSPTREYSTGDDGGVEIKLPIGRQKIRVSAEGYKPKEIELNGERGGSVTVDLASLSPLFVREEITDERRWTDEHRWIAFGEYNGKPLIWRILSSWERDERLPATEEHVRTAFLLAEDTVAEEMKFDDDSNDWDSSDIKKWLNEDFYRAAFSEEEREAILTSTYRYGGLFNGSDKTAASKVFLLSADEANDGRYFSGDDDRSIGTSWWLRSPGSFGRAASVDCDGEVYGGGLGNDYVDDARAVRPALLLNLSSSIFTSSSSKYEILYPVTLKLRDADTRPIYGAAVATDSPKQKYFTRPDGTVELKLNEGNNKIRTSAWNRVREFTLNIERGGGEFTVYLESDGVRFDADVSGESYARASEVTPEEVRLLVARGADVNRADQYGRTPLMRAASYNSNAEVIKALVQAGADVNAKDKDGRTALEFAEDNESANKSEIMALLRKAISGNIEAVP